MTSSTSQTAHNDIDGASVLSTSTLASTVSLLKGVLQSKIHGSSSELRRRHKKKCEQVERQWAKKESGPQP
jgi:hypothetical protein